MQITVDTGVDSPEAIRSACALLLQFVGDIPHAVIGDDAELTEDQRRALYPPRGVDAPPPPPAPDAPPPPPPPPAPAGVEVEIPPTPQFPTSGAAAVTGGTAPSAAAPPAASAAPATSHSERDSAGIPWDERIHQKGHSKKKDGTWKIRKNCDPTLVTAVIQELTAAKMSAVAVPHTAAAQVSLPLPATGTAGGVPVPPVAPQPPAAPVSVAVPAPPVPAAPVAAAGAVPAGGAAGPTFRDLVAKFTNATTSNRIKPEDVATICGQAGAPSLMSLINRPDLIAQVDTLLDARLLGG